jgi:predicted dehydrogenase
MSKPINIAILSTAHVHTRSFIDNLKKGANGRKAYAVWDDVVDRGKRYATDCGARFEGDLAALLADKQVDGFMICAENTRHMRLLEQALPVGKPVMCEKPLLTTGAELAKVRELIAKHRPTLVCGYFKPFTGEMRAIAKAIKDGVFGRITAARYRNAHHAAYGRWFDNPDVAWFTDPALAGGGAFMDMGTHAVHLLRSLFGPVEAVTATIANRCGEYPKVDDHGIGLLRFASGALGTVEASWVHQGGPTGLEIQGTKAALWSEGGRYVIGKPDQKAEPVTPIEARPSTVDCLIAVIQKEIPADELSADLDAILDAVAIMEAAYQANAKGGWVETGKKAAAR